MKKKIALLMALITFTLPITACESPFGPSEEELAAQAAEQARLEEEARLVEEERLKQERLDNIAIEQEQKDSLTQRYSSITGHVMSKEIEWESKLASEQLEPTESVEESTEIVEESTESAQSGQSDIPMNNYASFYDACHSYGDITALQYDIVDDAIVLQMLCYGEVSGSRIVTIIGTCTPITTECTNELSRQLVQQVNPEYNADTFKALDLLSTLTDVSSQTVVSICSRQGVSISATGEDSLILVIDEYLVDVKSATVEDTTTTNDGAYIVVQHSGLDILNMYRRKSL